MSFKIDFLRISILKVEDLYNFDSSYSLHLIGIYMVIDLVN